MNNAPSQHNENRHHLYNSVMDLGRAHNEDCLVFMRRLEIGKDDFQGFDLIIADPPYFKVFGEFDFQWKTVEEYIEWCRQWISECARLLKPDGSFYLWGKMGFGNGFALPKLAIWIEETKLFHIVNWVTQRNCRGRGRYRGFVQAREELLFCVKNEEDYHWAKTFTDERTDRSDLGANGKPRQHDFKRTTDVWIDIAEASQSCYERFKMSDGSTFPTVKAQRLCDRILQSSSAKNDLVFIPFAGSGSEIVSCIRNERRWVATEICKQYIDEIILKRIAQVNDPEQSKPKAKMIDGQEIVFEP